MGNCCSNEHSFETLVNSEVTALKVNDLQYPFIKPLFYNNDSQVPKVTLSSLSPESQEIYRKTLLSLSKEQFLNISRNIFYEEENLYQVSLFNHLYDLSDKKRAFLYFFMIVLSNSSPDDKLNVIKESVFTLEEQKTVKYSTINEYIKTYVLCALVSPLLALKDTIKEEYVIEKINDSLLQEYNEVNISNFVDLICQKYESVHLNEENEHKMICSPNNVDELLRDSKHYFFNVLYLRDTFMKVIGVE